MAKTKTQTFIADNFTTITTNLTQAATLALTAVGAFLVAEGNVEHFAKKMISLANRAKKNSMSAFSLTVHGYNDVEGVADDNATLSQVDGEWTADDLAVIRFARNFHGNRVAVVMRRLYVVSVAGDVQLPGGWKFIATLQHAEAGNIIRTVPTFQGNLPAWARKTGASNCDHCGTTRKRKDTYVLQNEASELKQVGSTCIKDFLGHDADGIAKCAAQGLLLGSGGYDDERMADDMGPTRWGIEAFLKTVAACIRAFGWTSRGQARDQGIAATADQVIRLLGKPPTNAAARAAWIREWATIRECQTDARNLEAEKALEWARAIDPDTDSDFLHNVRTACTPDSLTGREAGIVAAVINAANRDADRAAQRERAAALTINEWIGVAGDKIGRKLSAKDKRNGATAHPALAVELVFLKTFDTDYGCSTLLKFRSDAGHMLSWFASGYKDDIEVGDRFELCATIKKQDTYQGTKTTALTRCALTRYADDA